MTNHLFKKVGAKFGLDLVSFNMQRGREFGIPSYMEFRLAHFATDIQFIQIYRDFIKTYDSQKPTLDT